MTITIRQAAAEGWSEWAMEHTADGFRKSLAAAAFSLDGLWINVNHPEDAEKAWQDYWKDPEYDRKQPFETYLKVFKEYLRGTGYEVD
jgi:hypothetical protein